MDVSGVCVHLAHSDHFIAFVFINTVIKILRDGTTRETRFVPVFAKLPYKERLRRLELTSLEDRRLRGDVIEAFKYMHKIYNVDESEMLPRHTQEGMMTRGHSLKLLKRSCNSQVRANFFGLRVVNKWNLLPENVVVSSSVNCFKVLSIYLGLHGVHWNNEAYCEF